MHSARSSPSPEVFALSWKIPRYGPPPLTLPTTLIGTTAYEGKQTIESLAPRVKTLVELLCEPVPEDDAKEQERRKRLEL